MIKKTVAHCLYSFPRRTTASLQALPSDARITASFRANVFRAGDSASDHKHIARVAHKRILRRAPLLAFSITRTAQMDALKFGFLWEKKFCKEANYSGSQPEKKIGKDTAKENKKNHRGGGRADGLY